VGTIALSRTYIAPAGAPVLHSVDEALLTAKVSRTICLDCSDRYYCCHRRATERGILIGARQAEHLMSLAPALMHYTGHPSAEWLPVFTRWLDWDKVEPDHEQLFGGGFSIRLARSKGDCNCAMMNSMSGCILRCHERARGGEGNNCVPINCRLLPAQLSNGILGLAPGYPDSFHCAISPTGALNGAVGYSLLELVIGDIDYIFRRLGAGLELRNIAFSWKAKTAKVAEEVK